MPEKLCANESIHPAHEWPSVPSYRCPGIGLTLRAEQARVSAPKPPVQERELTDEIDRLRIAKGLLTDRVSGLYRLGDERSTQHSAQVRGLRKRIKNLKARVTTADEVLAHAARTADVTPFRDKYLREELRKRAELAEARTVEAQDQLDDALATLNKVREHALHMTTGKTGRPDKAHGRTLLKILKGDRS